MIDPGPGSFWIAFPRELVHSQHMFQNERRSEIPSYPLCTPSTRTSTHHTPGIPRMHHKLPFRRAPPAGIHWTRKIHTAQAKIKKGIRREKRNCQFLVSVVEYDYEKHTYKVIGCQERTAIRRRNGKERRNARS